MKMRHQMHKRAPAALLLFCALLILPFGDGLSTSGHKLPSPPLPPPPPPPQQQQPQQQQQRSSYDMTRRALLLTSPLLLSSFRPLGVVASEESEPRRGLLAAIDRGASEAEVSALLEALIPLDPSKGQAARSPSLSGTWELIWSAKAEAFSPLLRLPPPLRPASYQLLGSKAMSDAMGPGNEGRVAQVLRGGVLGAVGSELWLSSGVAPAGDGAGEVLEIFPPFRLDKTGRDGGRRTNLVEAGSDADFRAVNGRTSEAQAAPKNRYAQLYLETTGAAGDLRISTITSGDPVIVGATFVHRRVV